MSDAIRNARIDGLLANIAPGKDNRLEATRITEAAKASGLSAGQTALQLLDAGVCASSDAECRVVFSQSEALQHEFPSAEAYLAFRRSDRERAKYGR